MQPHSLSQLQKEEKVSDMSIYSALGIFYVTLCTGLVTAALLIGILTCTVTGAKAIWKQYQAGASATELT